MEGKCEEWWRGRNVAREKDAIPSKGNSKKWVARGESGHVVVVVVVLTQGNTKTRQRRMEKCKQT